MIDIKYRAWIVPLEQWADEISMEFTSYGMPPRPEACMQGDDWYRGEDIILEQFTGLYDSSSKSLGWCKKDRPLYVGDLIKSIYTSSLQKIAYIPNQGGFIAVHPENEDPKFGDRLYAILRDTPMLMVGNVHVGVVK